jgi:hypothetical protein
VTNHLFERQCVVAESPIALRWVDSVGIGGVVLGNEATERKRALSGEEIIDADRGSRLVLVLIVDRCS